MGTGVNDRGASAKYIRRAVEGSLKRLHAGHRLRDGGFAST